MAEPSVSVVARVRFDTAEPRYRGAVEFDACGCGRLNTMDSYLQYNHKHRTKTAALGCAERILYKAKHALAVWVS